MVRYFGQTTDVRIFNPGSAPPTQFVTLCLLGVCFQFANLARILPMQRLTEKVNEHVNHRTRDADRN